MSNDQPPPPAIALPFFGKSAALILGGALLAGLLVLLSLTHRDQVHRAVAEEEARVAGEQVPRRRFLRGTAKIFERRRR